MASLPDVPVTPSIAALAAQATSSSGKINSSLASEIHEYAIPDIARTAIDKLYGSLYASVRYLELCRSAQVLPHTWLGYSQGEIQCVLLFEIRSSTLFVLSEMIALTAVQIESFARSVLARYPTVMRIQFNAVYAKFAQLNLPSQRCVFSENYILDLPEHADCYLQQLGKATRKTIRLYGNRLQKDFPDFTWKACTADALSPALQQSLLLQLQTFKQQSMLARNKKPEIHPAETRRILQLVAESGLFGMATINGEIRSGSVACRVGNNYVMLLSAADPALEKYRLGLLTCYWSVRDCIAHGGKQCHLLWGRYQYKSQLLAVPEELLRLTLYRSRHAMLAMPRSVIQIAIEAQQYRLQKWLLYEVPRRSDHWSRLLARLMVAVREVRRKLARPAVIIPSGMDQQS